MRDIVDYTNFLIHRIRVGLSSRARKLPRGVFYKYRPIGANGSTTRQRLKDIIVGQDIYFSRPSSFNDPFDCHPQVLAGFTRRQFDAFIDGIIAGKPASVPRDSLRKNIALVQTNGDVRNEIYRQIVDSSTAVFSMSKTPYSILQWAYYADSHAGVCLEFSLSEGDCGAQLYEVEYTQRRLTLDVALAARNERYRSKQVLKSATTKGLSWAHEQEVRAIRIKDGVAKLPTSALTAIGFGLKTSPADRQTVRRWAAQAGLKIDFFELKDNPKDFGLERS